MKYFKAIILLLLLLIPVISCTERIDIELDDSYIRLVVEGAVTTDTMAHTVLLSKTASYYYNQPPPVVTGAEVIISSGEQSYELREVEPGVYRTASDVHGIPGKTYTLNIRLAGEIGGYADYAATATLNPVNPLDSIGLLFHSDWSTDGIWEVNCFIQDSPTNDFYRFIISKNGDILTDTLNEWFVTDDRFINGNYAYGATIAYLDQGSGDEGLVPGDIITVEINSIGAEYANFLWEAQSELRGSNPLFSGPPSNVKGNISNGAFGFFAAYSASRAYAITPVLK